MLIRKSITLLFLLLCINLSIQQNCGTISTFEDGKQPTNQLFVSASGSASGTGTQANPFDTIQKAVNAATPGTAIRILPGNYATSQRLYITDLAGTEQNPIWLGGVPGMTKPRFGSASVVEAIHLTRVKYFILHDIEVVGASINGINADDGGGSYSPTNAHRIIFRDLHIHDIGTGGNQDCLKLSGIHHHVVRDNLFEDCSSSGVDHVGCHHGLIVRNEFRRCGNGVQSKGGASDIEIRWNRFFNTKTRSLNMGGSTGFEFFRPPLSTTTVNFEAKDIRSIANLFVADGDCAHAFVGCVDCLAAHNTVVNTEMRLFRILQETVTSGGYTFAQAQNGLIINNLLYFTRAVVNSGGRAINVGANTSPATFRWERNWWYATDGSVFTPSYTGGTTVNEVYNTNPLLNLSTYRLQSSSTAIGAGSASSLSRGVSGDLSGNCYANPPSIGAFEGNPPTTTSSSSSSSSSSSTTTTTTTSTSTSTSTSSTGSGTTAGPSLRVKVSVTLPRPSSQINLGAFVNDITLILNIPANAIADVLVDLDKSTPLVTYIEFIIIDAPRGDGTRVDPIATANRLRDVTQSNPQQFEGTTLEGLQVAEVNVVSNQEDEKDEPFVGSTTFIIIVACVGGVVVIGVIASVAIFFKKRNASTGWI